MFFRRGDDPETSPDGLLGAGVLRRRNGSGVAVKHGDRETGVHADMAGGCAGPQPPCTGHMPNCVDHVGCVTVSALPASPISVAVAFEWASPDYDLVSESLAGISVKPALLPPILAA
jgi:hypothetical protein